MPAFLDSRSPALDSLNIAKRRVLANEKKQATLSAIPIPIEGEAPADVGALYDTFIGMLNQTGTDMNEFETIIGTFVRAPNNISASTATQRMTTVVTSLMNDYINLTQFLDVSLGNTLNMFDEKQFRSIQKSIDRIRGYGRRTDALVPTIVHPNPQAFVEAQIDELQPSIRQFGLLMLDLISTYQPTQSGAGLRGGSSRSSVPNPIDTFGKSLPGLPRRFL